MLEKYPDIRLQAAITELNQQFIRLLMEPSLDPDAPLLGMPSAYREGLACLNHEQLEAISVLPCLLAELKPAAPDGGSEGIAEHTPCYVPGSDNWLNNLCLFAAEVLTFIWQIKQRDPTFTAIVTGFGPAEAQLWDQVSFATIRHRASIPLQTLRVRFAQHPRFWPDLIRAARRDIEEQQQVARLTSLPLSIADCWTRQHASRSQNHG